MKTSKQLLIVLFVLVVLSTGHDKIDPNDYVPGREIDFVGVRGQSRMDIPSCELTLLQRRFCILDFAIMARKAGPIRRFFGDPASYRKPHYGLIVPMLIEQVFRGVLKNDTLVYMHFMLDRHGLGVNESAIPVDNHPFILTGYLENTIDSRDVKKVVPVVTSCSDSIPVESLSDTQIFGIFYGAYCANTTSSNIIKAEDFEEKRDGKETCYFPLKLKECYEKYMVCQKGGGWSTISVSGVKPSRVPLELNGRVISPEVEEKEIGNFRRCVDEINSQKL